MGFRGQYGSDKQRRQGRKRGYFHNVSLPLLLFSPYFPYLP